MTSPLVSVVVVNFNGKQHLEELLPSLREQEFPHGEFEVVLVDNGSNDGSIPYAIKYFPDVRVIPLKTNTGFARGNNEGVESARGDFVALVNNDTRVAPEWLDAHYRALTGSNGDTACTSGRILDWEGEIIDFIRGILTFDGHAFQLHQGRPVNSLEKETTETMLPFPCGGNMMIRKSLFQKMGGFDEDFFAYLEDVDLGWRLNLAGHRVVYQPDALVYHRGSATGLKLGMFKRAYLFEKNAYMVAYKNMEEPYLRGLHPAILYTFMHRTQRVISREPSVHGDLFLDPYTEGGGKKKLSIRSEHGRNLLRAWTWLMSHGRLLHEKRQAVQALRRQSDKVFFKHFPLHIVPTYPGDDLLFSGPFFNALLPKEMDFVRKPLSRVIKT